MADNFDATLDRCLDRLQSGEALESVIAGFPADAARLRPLLDAALRTGAAYAAAPSPASKRSSRLQLDAAIVALRESRRQKRPWFKRAIARPATWAALATLAVVLGVVYAGVRPVLSPGAPQILQIVPVASPTGNFAFLISDEVNAIAEFREVIVGIDRIGLQQSADGKWIEFKPSVLSVDLTMVPGDLVQEIWKGDIPAGDYRQVFIYVDNVSGTLISSDETVEIKLPSRKLHLNVPFTVADNAVTSFTYDLTVIRTGNAQNGRYLLKPQVSESGATQAPRDAKDKGQPGEPGKPVAPPDRPTSLPTPGNKPTKK